MSVSGKVPPCAMVMAAGHGTRMRPLTDHKPKPLIEVVGRPLIDEALSLLHDAGVQRAVVNVHYLADQIEAHLGQEHCGLRIRISDERNALLETGGGVVKALPLIDCDPFLSINTDCIWGRGKEAVQQLADGFDADRMDALLLLLPLAQAHGHDGNGDFIMDAAGRITRQPKETPAPFVYSGLQILSKRLLKGAPVGAFSLRDLWDRATCEGRLFGVVHHGYWHDVGTLAAKAEVEARHG